MQFPYRPKLSLASLVKALSLLPTRPSSMSSLSFRLLCRIDPTNLEKRFPCGNEKRVKNNEKGERKSQRTMNAVPPVLMTQMMDVVVLSESINFAPSIRPGKEIVLNLPPSQAFRAERAIKRAERSG